MKSSLISDCEVINLLNDTPEQDLVLNADHLVQFFLEGMQDGKNSAELARVLYDKMPMRHQTSRNLIELEEFSEKTIAAWPIKSRLQFAATVQQQEVSQHSQNVLYDLMKKTGITQMKVTSSHRSPKDQARIMYQNLQLKGVEHQKKLYGHYGDQVIQVYEKLRAQGRSADEIRTAMTMKINELGPRNVSRHCVDTRFLNVIDIAPSSIPLSQHASFIKMANADPNISVVLGPPRDTSFHIEIPQHVTS